MNLSTYFICWGNFSSTIGFGCLIGYLILAKISSSSSSSSRYLNFSAKKEGLFQTSFGFLSASDSKIGCYTNGISVTLTTFD